MRPVDRPHSAFLNMTIHGSFESRKVGPRSQIELGKSCLSNKQPVSQWFSKASDRPEIYSVFEYFEELERAFMPMHSKMMLQN